MYPFITYPTAGGGAPVVVGRIVEVHTVVAGDITNGYLQMAGDITDASKVTVSILGAGGQANGTSFGANAATDRVNITGFDLASQWVAGDVFTVVYT